MSSVTVPEDTLAAYDEILNVYNLLTSFPSSSILLLQSNRPNVQKYEL